MGCTSHSIDHNGVENGTSVDTTTTYIKEIVVFDTTFVSKLSEFQVIAGKNKKDDVYAYIIKNKLDTTSIFGAAGGVDVEDFNSDGFPDVIVCYLGNVRVCDLYLFDSDQVTFTEVGGFRAVSDAKPISERNDTYYAYQRAGCADENWTSTLFEIIDHKVQEIGEIEGTGCEREDQQKGITVYKIEMLDNVVEVDHLPIDTIETYEENKWGFIADYWNTNLDKFLK